MQSYRPVLLKSSIWQCDVDKPLIDSHHLVSFRTFVLIIRIRYMVGIKYLYFPISMYLGSSRLLETKLASASLQSTKYILLMLKHVALKVANSGHLNNWVFFYLHWFHLVQAVVRYSTLLTTANYLNVKRCVCRCDKRQTNQKLFRKQTFLRKLLNECVQSEEGESIGS